MQETRVRSLGREDPVEKEMATHFSILAWRLPRSEQATVYGVTKSRTRLSKFTLGSRSGGVSPSNQVQLVSMLLSLILPYSGSFLILSSLSTYLFFFFSDREEKFLCRLIYLLDLEKSQIIDVLKQTSVLNITIMPFGRFIDN